MMSTDRGANSAPDHFLRIDRPSFLSSVLATLLFDWVKVVAAVRNLRVKQFRQLVRDRLVLLDGPLQHGTRPAVARCNEEIDLLASADEAVAGVVGVQHHKASRSNWIQWESDIHLCRKSFVCSI